MSENPNFLVIVTDSLRADHMGCYGSDVSTPNIDSLAENGIKFERAYSENLPTMPTRRGWWAGKYHFYEAGWEPFPEEDNLLAERLWDKDFCSALITDTYHMHKPHYNCGRGFDRVSFIRGQEYDPWIVDPSIDVSVEESPEHRMKEDCDADLWRRRYRQYLKNNTARKGEEDRCAPRVVREAQNWLDDAVDRKEDSIFLWVDMFDPHEVWDPPSEYRDMYKDESYDGPDLVDPVPGDIDGYMTSEEVQNTKNLYAGQVTYTDIWVGKLLDHLKKLGIWDDTVVIHTTDHGEPFGEHGYIRKAKPRNYEELVHIPWVLKLPDNQYGGTKIGELVQTVDLMPTLLDLMNLDFPPSDEEQKGGYDRNPKLGKSLLPMIEGDRDKIGDYVYGGHYGKEWYIRDEKWTYLFPLNEREPELYDRSRDPREQENIVKENGSKAQELKRELRDFVDSISEGKKSINPQ